MLRWIFRFVFVVVVLLAIVAGIVWYFRYDIFQFSAESVIQNSLPDYVHVDQITFDLDGGELVVEGFAIKNPSGFSDRYLMTTDRIVARYKMRGKNILDGIEVFDVEAQGPKINIERNRSGQLNINDMESVMNRAEARENAKAAVVEAIEDRGIDLGRFASKKIQDLVTLTDTIKIKEGKVSYIDKMMSSQGYLLTFEDFQGYIHIDMSPDYSSVRKVSSNGVGNVNGYPEQWIEWKIEWNPETPRLTLSSRFNLNLVDVMPFKPYYDKYSPVDILRGRTSGTLVFDFDNGNIGSTNELRFFALKLADKTSGTSARFWRAAASDILKYLETSPGEITFDFKIKGDMNDPQFMLGPHTKRAMQMMAVDTVRETINGFVTSPAEQGQAAVQGAQTDAERVADLIRGFIRD